MKTPLESDSQPPLKQSTLNRFVGGISARSLALDLLAGWFAWVAIIVGSIFQNSPSPISTFDVFEHLDHQWTTAFLWSLPVVLAASFIRATVNQRPRHVAFTTCMLYAGPISISCIGYALIDEFFRGYGKPDGIQQATGALMIIFYLLGIVFLAVKARRNTNQAIAAFLVPPYLIASLSVCVALFQVLNSADYIYRKAFYVTVASIETKEGGTHITGTFHVTKPGNYIFTAQGPGLFHLPDAVSESTTLSWKTTQPTGQGAYEFNIVRDDKIFTPMGENVIPSVAKNPSAPGSYENEPVVYLQISVLGTKADAAPEFVKSIPLNTWDINPPKPEAL